MPTVFLAATVTRCASLCPCTSALGESTRNSSAGSEKLFPSSNVTVRMRLSLSSLSSVGQESAMVTPHISAELDIALDHMVEPGTGGRQHHLHLQFALAAEVFLAHHALDLLLRSDAHLLKIFTERHVEPMFIHPWPPGTLHPMLWKARSTYRSTYI